MGGKDEKPKGMTFDEFVRTNVAPYTGAPFVDVATWTGQLTDIALALYQWEGNGLSFYDKLLVEECIFAHTDFALIKPRYKRGSLYVIGHPRIFMCTFDRRGARGYPKTVRVIADKLPKGMRRVYGEGEFIPFVNFSRSCPSVLVAKYADMLSKLDALYDQNIAKLSIPVIAGVQKSMKNDLLNVFRRTSENALFTMINQGKDNLENLFYNPEILFILDKINAERRSIMDEFIRELGLNPTTEVAERSQYVNERSVKEASITSKFFGACLNKYRDNFVSAVNTLWPEIDLRYRPTVELHGEVGE